MRAPLAALFLLLAVSHLLLLLRRDRADGGAWGRELAHTAMAAGMSGMLLPSLSPSLLAAGCLGYAGAAGYAGGMAVAGDEAAAPRLWARDAVAAAGMAYMVNPIGSYEAANLALALVFAVLAVLCLGQWRRRRGPAFGPATETVMAAGMALMFTLMPG